MSLLVVLLLVAVWYFFIRSDPGGPIVVIDPTQELMQVAPTVAPTGKMDYTDWYVGYPPLLSAPNQHPDHGQKSATLTGLPWRLGDKKGADKIRVAIVSSPSTTYPFKTNPVDAEKIELELDSARTLTIELPDKTVDSTWSLDVSGVRTKLTPKFLVFMPNWRQDLYGHMTKLQVTERSQPDKPVMVDVADLDHIAICYNPVPASPYCK